MSQRRKILRIGSTFLSSLLGRDTRQFYEVAHDGLPPDTKIVNCRMDDDFRTLVLCLESGEFDEVPEGKPYPELTTSVRSLDLKSLAVAGVN